MIKKLQMKLIGVSMFSLFLVFVVIMGAISFLNYEDVVEKADQTLLILAENDGRFPKIKDPSFHEEKDPFGIDTKLSPEMPYETRYFTVLFQNDGEIISVDTGKIAAIDTSTAKEYATYVFEEGKTKGFMNDYRFYMHTSGEETRILFLDCGRNLATFRSFVFTTIGVFLVGMLCVFVMIVFLFRYIVKPISESYEKQKQFFFSLIAHKDDNARRSKRDRADFFPLHGRTLSLLRDNSCPWVFPR